MKNDVLLTRAVKDIAYEIEMLLELYTLLWEHGRGAADRVFHYSAIEATTVHVRNLLDFYEHSRTPLSGKKSPDRDDVLAEDYDFPAQKFGFDSGIRKRIHKQVAHLTYTRSQIPEDDMPWPFRQFVPEILGRSYAFIRKLISDRKYVSSTQEAKICDLGLRLSRFV